MHDDARGRFGELARRGGVRQVVVVERTIRRIGGRLVMAELRIVFVAELVDHVASDRLVVERAGSLKNRPGVRIELAGYEVDGLLVLGR